MGRPKEKHEGAQRGRSHAQALKTSSKYKRGFTKQPSAELLPKKKYVSLRPGRHAKFTGYARNVLNSPSRERKSEQLVTEPPLKSTNRKGSSVAGNSWKNSAKSHERTPSLHHSKSRSIGKRKLTRRSETQGSREAARSPGRPI